MAIKKITEKEKVLAWINQIDAAFPKGPTVKSPEALDIISLLLRDNAETLKTARMNVEELL